MTTDGDVPAEGSQGPKEVPLMTVGLISEGPAIQKEEEEAKEGDKSAELIEAFPAEAIISAASEEEKAPENAIVDNVNDKNAIIPSSHIQESEAKPSQTDTNIAAEASADTEPTSDGTSELRRLRDLVFASRGSRANLPPGWEDDGVGSGATFAQEDSKEASIPVEETIAKEEAPIAEKTPIDEAAQKMLQRAIDVVGYYATDSDSDEDSSDSDSSSSSESNLSTTQPASKDVNLKKAVITNALSDDEDEGGAIGAQGPTTKNEVIEPTVDQPPYKSVPLEKEIRPLGKIHSIVDCVVVVAQDVGKAPGQHQQQNNGASHSYRQAPVDMHGRKGEEEGEYSVLDTGSLLTFADRNVLGVVYETFGSVLSPLYALRYSSASQVNKEMIQIGKPVCYVPRDSTYVLTRALRALGKGSDASNLWDEEVGDDEREFSDDEAEAEHKRNSKANRGKGKKRNHPEESSNGNGNGNGNNRAGPSRPFKHSLPSRPMMAPPVHRDEAATQQNMTLTYDDEEITPRQPMSAPPINPNVYSPGLPHLPQYSAPTPPSHDPYALWSYQQQQQQYRPPPHLSAMSPTSHQYQQSFYQPMQQPYYPTTSSSSGSYNPQQPYLGRPPPPQ
jgi:H/ACA ribonucleoprotein complex non-core subunit NAF1